MERHRPHHGALLLRMLLGALCALLAVQALRGQKPAMYKTKEEKLPRVVAPQPIPFSHKKHGTLGVGCLDCHAGAQDKGQAGLPDAEQCLTCHATMKADSPEIEKLADLAKQGDKVKWVRVYREPDYVFFSHASHVKAGQECATCHGPVQEREVLAQEVSASMTTCMNCHAEKNAPNECFICHHLIH